MSDKNRVLISVDGNCGCALIGENLQEGDAEFVQVYKREDEHMKDAENRACNLAYQMLCNRLGKQLPYELHSSHPRAV